MIGAERRLTTVRAPRFDLRLRKGRARLVLAEPYVGPGYRIAELESEIELGDGVSFEGGALRFRHAAARVVRAVVRVHPSTFATPDERLELRGGPEGEVRAMFVDAEGALSARLLAHAREGAVWLHVRSLSWVRSANRAPLARLVSVASRHGFDFDRSLRALVWRRPVRALLADALLPAGWRLPDERGLPGRFAIDGEGVMFELGARDAEEPEPGSIQVPAWEARWEEPGPPGGDAGALRAALEADEAPRTLRRLVAKIEAGWVRADAQLLVAAHLSDGGEDVGSLVLDALASRPRDAGAWRRWVSRLAMNGDANALRLADMALGGPLAKSTRAQLVADAVLLSLDHGAQWSDAHERTVEGLLQRAQQLAPSLPELVAARAAFEHRRGAVDTAADLYERAADLAAKASRLADAGSWRRRAAELLVGLRGPAAAEPLLILAMRELGETPTLVADLARLMAERGDRADADAMFGRLLRLPPESEGLRSALLAAVRHHVERGAADRARPFLAALGEGEAVGLAELSEILDGTDDLDAPLAPDSVPELDLESSASIVVLPPTSSPPDAERPPVTMVSARDDEVRALLDQAAELSDVRGLLEGALEQALADADADGVRRVLQVVERLGEFEGHEALRDRAERLLERLGDPS